MKNLAFHKSRPLTSKLSLRNVPAQSVFNQIPDFIYECKKAQPEISALKFYLSNHAWGLLQLRFSDHENLGDLDEVARVYHTGQHYEVTRMFYYLLVICTRETRHMHSGTKKENFYQKYPELAKFHNNKVADSTSFSTIKKMCLEVPDVTLGEYADFLVDAFKCGYSGGYGGAKWRVVAECAREFIHGNTTAEMMMDTAFTLAHNGGPIFNKGMLFKHYDSAELYKILDVQASGQIPQFISNATSGYASDFGVKGLWDTLANLIGTEFIEPVDWAKVSSKDGTNHDHIGEGLAAILDKKKKKQAYLEVVTDKVWIKKLTRKKVKAA